MLTIRCRVTGKVLGYAANSIIAYELAKTNGWVDWYVEACDD